MSKIFEIKVCKGCRSNFIQNRWQYSKNNKELLIKSFKAITEQKITNLKELFDLIDTKKKKFNYILEWSKEQIVNDKKILNKHTFKIKVLFDYCTICSRFKSGYYEGILQIRNSKNALFDKVIDTVFTAVEKNNSVFILKVNEIKDGVDIYLGSNKFLKAIGKTLHEKYGGDIKSSKKLFSVDRRTSKEIYRGTVLIRLPDFSVGDVVLVKNKYLYVSKISPKSISGFDIMLNKKTTIQYNDPEKIFEKNNIKSAMISKTQPQIEILHPKTYQSIKVENIKSNKTVKDKEINIIEIDKKFYSLSNFE
jgi:NMD protein affecting ribosome stability and mRNA decay